MRWRKFSTSQKECWTLTGTYNGGEEKRRQERTNSTPCPTNKPSQRAFIEPITKASTWSPFTSLCGVRCRRKSRIDTRSHSVHGWENEKDTLPTSYAEPPARYPHLGANIWRGSQGDVPRRKSVLIPRDDAPPTAANACEAQAQTDPSYALAHYDYIYDVIVDNPDQKTRLRRRMLLSFNTEANLMSEEIQQRLRAPVQPVEHPAISGPDQKNYASLGIAKIKWTFIGKPQVFEAAFHVVRDLDADLLLGRPSIQTLSLDQIDPEIAQRLHV
ncbi:hypothetical protein P170DRAFT_212196 [Aspergillus steynii IBT 23096]|uniref:Uncharacterized protein n=1 Tax=Aspergillus steynii IBT 23096 TaxID=1392250 RepID=A0A2I2G6G7_9EURO|nr:uncharacterized protein P170DRAFT_212196 [Aspergillus steynii IBT 23096]PLB48471.1 hypothetical protein P170DRAFT_212196 [Aspergillus steynii IBT 23096]